MKILSFFSFSWLCVQIRVCGVWLNRLSLRSKITLISHEWTKYFTLLHCLRIIWKMWILYFSCTFFSLLLNCVASSDEISLEWLVTRRLYHPTHKQHSRRMLTNLNFNFSWKIYRFFIDTHVNLTFSRANSTN